jgi:hypothetical protein
MLVKVMMLMMNHHGDVDDDDGDLYFLKARNRRPVFVCTLNKQRWTKVEERFVFKYCICTFVFKYCIFNLGKDDSTNSYYIIELNSQSKFSNRACASINEVIYLVLNLRTRMSKTANEINCPRFYSLLYYTWVWIIKVIQR